MGVMASQITSLLIVYLTVYKGTDQRKYQSSASLAFFYGEFTVTGESPAQSASNAENVSIWWHHHVLPDPLYVELIWRKANIYRKVSNIRLTLEGNKIVDHSDVVGASPVGAAPTTSSFST